MKCTVKEKHDRDWVTNDIVSTSTCLTIITLSGEKLHTFTSEYKKTIMEKIGKLIESAYKGKVKKLTKAELFGDDEVKWTQRHDLQHFNDCIMTAEQNGIKDRAK